LIGLDTVERILQMHEEQGLSQRAIARMLGISRNTVKRVIEDAGRYLHPARRGYRLTKPRPSIVLTDQIKATIKAILEEDLKKPKKKRRNTHQIYLELTRDPEIRYSGAESTLRRYVGAIRPTLGEAWIPLEFSPGEAFQADWVEVELEEEGRGRVAFQVFCFRLCYSRAIWAEAFYSQNEESFFQGHCDAFEFVGGVPRRGIYDNLKTAILEGSGKKAKERWEFTAFRLYYGFKADFCNPAEAHEKGQVEHLAKVVQRDLLFGIGKVESIAQLNETLRQRCLEYQDRKVPDGDETVRERLSKEREYLLQLPRYRWECSRRVDVKVNRSALVQHETNRYSVPVRYVGMTVLLKAYPHTIEVWAGTEKLAEHRRSYEKNKVFCQLDHYLDLLYARPRALRNSKALRQANLPSEFQKLMDRLIEEDPLNGPREMVRIFMLGREFGIDTLARAVGICLKIGGVGYDVVRHVLVHGTYPEGGSRIPMTLNLPKVEVRQPSPTRFNELLGGVGS